MRFAFELQDITTKIKNQLKLVFFRIMYRNVPNLKIACKSKPHNNDRIIFRPKALLLMKLYPVLPIEQSVMEWLLW